MPGLKSLLLTTAVVICSSAVFADQPVRLVQRLLATEPGDRPVRFAQFEPAPPSSSEPDPIPVPAPPAENDVPEAEPAEPDTPAAPQPAQIQPPAAQPVSPFTAPLTSASSPQSLTPGMIGDFGASSGSLATPTFIPVTINAVGNPFMPTSTTPGSHSGQPTATFSINTNGVLSLPATLLATQPPATGSSSSSVDMPGFTLLLTDPQNAIEQDVAATSGTAASLQEIRATLVSNGGPGLSVADSFNIQADVLVADPTEPLTPGSGVIIAIPDPAAPGLIVGRQKITENTSPLPRSRVFLNYSFFDNVPISPGGVNVNRFTPGFEYAMLDDTLSVELRAPFASTLDSDVVVGGFTDESEVLFGDLTVYLKALLYQDRQWAWSAGMGVTAPTAEDLSFALPGTTPLIEVENETVHLLPFIGGLYTPNDRLFVQGFVQMDIDTNGNPVLINADGTGLAQAGRIQDEEFLFVDLNFGYWLYQGERGGSMTGFAPMFEVHYNQALEEEDVVTQGPFRVGNPTGKQSLVNGVVGFTALFSNQLSFSGGYAFPMAGDEQFDGELRLIVNWFFGGRVQTPGTL